MPTIHGDVAMTSIPSAHRLLNRCSRWSAPGRHRPASGVGNADSGGGVQAMAAAFLPAQRVPLLLWPALGR